MWFVLFKWSAPHRQNVSECASFTCLSSEWVSCAHHQNVSEYASLKCLSSEWVSCACQFCGTNKVYVVFFFIGSFMGFFVLHMSVIRMSILCSSSECLSMCIVQVSVIWICITQVSVIRRSILNMSFLRYSLLHLECRFSNLHTQLII